MKLVLTRHGESEANYANYWTGWLDVDLTDKGIAEAHNAGQLLKRQDILFDHVFTSVLKRTIKTADALLDTAEQLYVPITKTWRLNERHYGALVGKNKAEMAAEFGEAQVKLWRRGYHEVPPLLADNHFDRRYDALDPERIPHGESLAMTMERVLPLWEDELAPRLLDGKDLLVVGHGNSLRVLIKYLEHVADDQVNTIDVPTAEPIVYTLDSKLSIVNKEILHKK